VIFVYFRFLNGYGFFFHLSLLAFGLKPFSLNLSFVVFGLKPSPSNRDDRVSFGVSSSLIVSITSETVGRSARKSISSSVISSVPSVSLSVSIDNSEGSSVCVGISDGSSD